MSIGQSVAQVWSNMTHVISNIGGSTLLGKLGVTASALLTAYFTPIMGLLTCCFATTFVDMLYGIEVAKRQHRKITSDQNRKGTWNKIKGEFAIIGLARLLEFTVLGTDGVFVLTGGATVIITLTELWSILENLNTINPNGPWRALGQFLKKKGEAYAGVELNLNEHDDNSTNKGADIESKKSV